MNRSFPPTRASMSQRCLWCGSDKPGKRGFVESLRTAWQDPRHGKTVTYHRFRHDCILHPLRAIFMVAGFNSCEGMNWLQDRGLVSDNCIDPWQVAPVDLWEVLEQAAFRFNPAWLAQVRKSFCEKMEIPD